VTAKDVFPFQMSAARAT